MIRVTIEAPDVGQLERELEVVLNRLRSTRGAGGTLHVVPSAPAAGGAPPPPSDNAAVVMCPDHPEVGPMTWKPADPAKGRQAAYWCKVYGCRRFVVSA